MNDTATKMATLNGLAGNYSATFSPETAKMWLFLLQDYSAAQVQTAALNLIRKHADVPYKSLPPFALMQEELDLLDNTIRGEKNIELQAEAEWNALLSNIRDYGSWSEPELNPVTTNVVRMLGGWKVACSWLESELHFRHKDFVDLWKQMQGKEDYVALGAEGVKQLASPASKREKLDLIGTKQRLFAMPENILRDKDPEPAQEKKRPSLPTDYIPQTPLTPEQEKIRASLVAYREKIRGSAVVEAMSA